MQWNIWNKKVADKHSKKKQPSFKPFLNMPDCTYIKRCNYIHEPLKKDIRCYKCGNDFNTQSTANSGKDFFKKPNLVHKLQKSCPKSVLNVHPKQKLLWNKHTISFKIGGYILQFLTLYRRKYNVCNKLFLKQMKIMWHNKKILNVSPLF